MIRRTKKTEEKHPDHHRFRLTQQEFGSIISSVPVFTERFVKQERSEFPVFTRGTTDVRQDGLSAAESVERFDPDGDKPKGER